MSIENTNHKRFKTVRVEVMLNLKSDANMLYNTKFTEDEYNDRYNIYRGFVQAYQSGSHTGETKTYYNNNGILQVESSKWIGKEPQTVESRKIASNWDETQKIFINAEIKTIKKDYVSEDDMKNMWNNKNNNIIIIKFNGKTYSLFPGHYIQFGDINNQKVRFLNQQQYSETH